MNNRRYTKTQRTKSILLLFTVFAALLSLISTTIALSATNRQGNETIEITYSAGKYLTHSDEGDGELVDTNLFDTFTMVESQQTTVSGTLILPGERFSDNVTVDESKKSNTLDDETFYFADSDNDGDYTDEWAYTFTGWMIYVDENNDGVNDITDKIPSETVFQPGDVIRPDTLEKYLTGTGENKTLALEALWGKCYFIRNPYTNMEYKLQTTLAAGEEKLLYVFDEAASKTASTPEGDVAPAPMSSDDNAGNDPARPMATIDALYETIREELGVSESETDKDVYTAAVKAAQKNPLTYDAYSRVVMLTGDLDYYTDSNQKQAQYYGYLGVPHAGGSTGESKQYGVWVSATYKSLGDTPYDYNYKPKGYASTVFGNFRFDNINFKLAPATIFGGQTRSSEFLLAHIMKTESIYDNYAEGATEKSYLEITARYNTEMKGASTAASTLRPNDATYVVVNGGSFGGIQNQYTSSVTNGKALTWTFGRNINVTGTIHCGTTSSYEDNCLNLYYDYEVYILGGHIAEFYGGSNGINSISAGKRVITLLGDGTANGTSTEYDPKVEQLCGGAAQARLFVDGGIHVTAKNCTNLVSVYGGGRDFSATTYGDIYVILENCVLSGDLHGGGLYANCEPTPATYIHYRTVNKQIYGIERNISDLMESATTKVDLNGEGQTVATESVIGSSIDTSWVSVDYGGDVYVTVNNTKVDGTVYGSGMGNTQTIMVSTQYTIAEDWKPTDPDYKEGGVYVGSDRPANNGYSPDGEWFEPLNDYPVYDYERNSVYIYGYRDGSYTENSPDIMSYFTKRTYASMSLATVENVYIDIIGSEVGKDVYGGGAVAQVKENTKVKITNSTIHGNVYGGGDGVTLAGKVKVYWPEDDTANNGTYTAPSYAATPKDGGSGWTVTWTAQKPTQNQKKSIEYSWTNDESVLTELGGIDHENKLLYTPSKQTERGSVLGNTSVIIDGTTTVHGNVYGGGNHGIVYNDTSVEIGGGILEAQVFGGGNGDATQDKTDVLGLVEGNTTLTISGGNVNEAYGGANAADIGGNVTLTISGGTVSYAFGGNNEKGVISGSIEVTLSESGKVTNQLFGGGNMADYAGTPNLTISGGSVGDYNSGQNEGGTVTGTAYGGGKLAAVDGTNVIVTNGEIRSLFGGSYQADIGDEEALAAETDPFDVVNVKITGGKIKTFCGGNDQDGNIYGGINITVGNKNDDAEANKNVYIRNFFGGGNSADYTYGANWVPEVSRENYDDQPDSTFKGITVNIHSGEIYQAFGGGVMASIENARMYVDGGEFHFLYGGGYNGDAVYTVIHLHGGEVVGEMLPEGLTTDPTDEHGGYVFGGGYEGYVYSASLHLEDTVDDNGNNVGQVLAIQHSVFGGGNKADVHETNVIVKSGTVTGSIYGGGFEGEADNTVVTLSGGNLGKGTYINGNFYDGNVYGGGYLGETGTTHIDIAEVHHDYNIDLTLGGNVYGGGHNADVTGNTYVHFLTGSIEKNIYGGGRNGNVDGTAHVDFTSGELGGDVYGGGYKGTVGKTRVFVSNKPEVIAATDEDLFASFYKLVEELKIEPNIQINGNVFGGGEGVEATVYEDTIVKVDIPYDFKVTEIPTSTDEITSGEEKISLEVIGDNPDYIGGNVYGGGDLGAVGTGTIDNNNNTATVTREGRTSVTVTSGHIRGSVFAGGNGNPKEGAYTANMGAVFGKTEVTINGGYIETNVYGGGTRSRVYAGADGMASHVLIQEVKNSLIAIGGSVFGGGDRGNNVNTNANIPTMVGDVKVHIISLDETSNVFFLEGGVYGDGNLCLVKGYREILLRNFNTGNEKTLKTFHSLQRADLVILDNTDIVLLGAIDLVEEGDTTEYSINRVGYLKMTGGSTFKLDRIVKYLGGLESDISTDRRFIIEGNNGSNNYNAATNPEVLTDEEIDSYREPASSLTRSEIEVTDADKNTVCVANGLYLEIIRLDGEYGPVTGLFTLELLYANPGEGGGFVYGDITGSTGDFICEAKKGYTYEYVGNISEELFNQNHNEASNDYYVRKVGKGYVKATEYDADALYYTRQMAEGYMDVVDDVGGYENGTYTYYVWYIGGPFISYTGSTTGYIGAEITEFPMSRTLPYHDQSLYYVLYGIVGNDVLQTALSNGTYTLVQNSTVEDKEIGIEIKHGDISLGFLTYDPDVDESQRWGLQLPNDTTIYGYGGVTGTQIYNMLTIGSITIEPENSKLSVVLHKSKDVDEEQKGMQVSFDIELFDENLTPYANGTSTLMYNIDVNIERMNPVQKLFTDAIKGYAGIQELKEISITGDSAFTAQYQTEYLPAAFPKDDDKKMTWLLSAEEFSYYFHQETGTYLTIGPKGPHDVRNISSGVDYSEQTPSNEGEIYYDPDADKYYYKYSNDEGIVSGEMEKDERMSTITSVFPKNTKITMVDLSDPQRPTYYYYLVAADNGETTISLDEFCVMGTITKISDLDNVKKPKFMQSYADSSSSFVLVKEDIVFIFDYMNVNWEQPIGSVIDTTWKTYSFRGGSNLILKHEYASKDIMDHVKTGTDEEPDIRETPKRTEYFIDATQNGITYDDEEISFEAEAYYDKDTLTLNLEFDETADWINTLFSEGEFSLMLELLNKNNASVEFPVGIEFIYKGNVYHVGVGGKHAVIPLESFGKHTIEIKNLLYKLYSSCNPEDVLVDQDKPIARFKLTLYSAPDASYYNANDLIVGGERAYVIWENPTYSISASVSDENQIYQKGDTVNIDVTSYLDGKEITPSDIEFSVEKKGTDGEYQSATLFVAQPSDTEPNKNMTLTIGPNAEAGTYRLKFVYGNRTEYLYLIVLE